jgi:4-amino-4-deoxychorismate lyase
MCQLIESLKVQYNSLFNIDYHNERFNMSRKALFGCTDFIDLQEFVKPSFNDNEIYKCRVLYKKHVEKVEFIPYKPKKISSLKLVNCEDIDYTYKYADKKRFDELLANNPGYDDILIVRNGLITDTSFSNIAFYDGKKWLTPSEPLLKGTKRECLLRNKLIFEEMIKATDICRFEKAILLNALLDIDESRLFLVKDVIFI